MPAGKVVVLEDNIQAVRHAVTGAMLMDAAKAGGFVIEGHAKLNASKGGKTHLNIQTGHLVNAIKVFEGKKSDTYADVDIGPSGVIYARIHELGGIIKPFRAKLLHWVNEAGEHISKGSVHIPARPYMRPAIDENEDNIVKAVEAEIWRNLDKATK